MLSQAPVTTILPVIDLDRARQYYQKQLGLTPLGLKADGKFEFATASGVIALIPKPGGTKAEHTAISFQVPDILTAIETLKRNGVVFDDYDLPGLKTVDHVCVLGAEKAAWFKDTEGNILCLHEDIN